MDGTLVGVVRTAVISLSVITAVTVVTSAQETRPRLILESLPPVLLDGDPTWSARWLGPDLVGIGDVTNHRVVVADLATGKFGSFGRRGDGPGEFRAVSPPYPGPKGALGVLDITLRRLTVLTSDLKYQRTYPVPWLTADLLSWDEGGLVAVWLDAGVMGPPHFGRAVLSAKGETLFDRGLDTDSLFKDVPTDGSPRPVVSALDEQGNLYLADARKYEIRRLSPAGKVLGSLTRTDVRPERLSSEEADELLARTFKMAGITFSPADRATMRAQLASKDKPLFRSSGISVDALGQVWVVTTRRTKNGGTEVDVFAPKGTFQGTVALRGDVRSLTWRGNRAVAVVMRSSEETHGLGVIDVYRRP
jgi:hypothetical protein